MTNGLLEVAAVFLKLGLLAVGGPAAHVALMRREVVIKRRWLDEKAFLDGFAACQLIPGPSSTELAILLGYRRAGLSGLVIAGTLFILPAMVMMLILAWVYQHFAASTAIAQALQGVRPVVVAVMSWAVIDLGRRLIGGVFPLLIGAGVVVGGLAGLNPIALLIAGGIAMVIQKAPILPSPKGEGNNLRSLLLAASGPINTGLFGVLIVFLKYGVVSFGSGYVLFAFLNADVVTTFHWLTTQQLVDGIALSQATPGPVFTVATFIGFLVAGVAGAVLATIGIFLPGFILVPFLDRFVRLINDRPWAKAFLQGVNVAALGLIGEVAIQLGRSALINPLTVAIAAVSVLVLIRLPLAAPALVVAGGIIGLVGVR